MFNLIPMLHYFGFGVVIVKGNAGDSGQNVTLTDGNRTWSGTMADGECKFTMVPGKKDYHIEVSDGTNARTEDIHLGYGETRVLELVSVGVARIYENQKAYVSSFVEDTTYEDFPYKGVVTIDARLILTRGAVTERDFCVLTPTKEVADLGILSEEAESFDGGIYVWTSEKPTLDLQFAVVTAERGEANEK